jgi:DNA helicase HerA-like ATPase
MTMMHLPSPPDDRDVLLGREIDDLLLRLRGLVLVRDLLAERGATAAEIDEHAREADRVRMRLAALIGGQEGAAAA